MRQVLLTNVRERSFFTRRQNAAEIDITLATYARELGFYRKEQRQLFCRIERTNDEPAEHEAEDTPFNEISRWTKGDSSHASWIRSRIQIEPDQPFLVERHIDEGGLGGVSGSEPERYSHRMNLTLRLTVDVGNMEIYGDGPPRIRHVFPPCREALDRGIGYLVKAELFKVHELVVDVLTKGRDEDPEDVPVSDTNRLAFAKNCATAFRNHLEEGRALQQWAFRFDDYYGGWRKRESNGRWPTEFSVAEALSKHKEPYSFWGKTLTDLQRRAPSMKRFMDGFDIDHEERGEGIWNVDDDEGAFWVEEEDGSDAWICEGHVEAKGKDNEEATDEDEEMDDEDTDDEDMDVTSATDA